MHPVDQATAEIEELRQHDQYRALRGLLVIHRMDSLMPAEAAGQPPSLTPGHASAGALPAESV